MTTPTQAEPSDPIVELMRSLAADRRFDAMPWRARAACKGETDLFYARAGERPERAQVRESVAVAMCEACPVWRDCRRYARKHREYGVWGGETELERALAGFGPRMPVGLVAKAMSTVGGKGDR